jgi:formylglycine-generating enzyme required for sulfatase activity
LANSLSAAPAIDRLNTMPSNGKSAHSSASNLTTYSFETVTVDRNGEINTRRAGSAPCRIAHLGAEIDLDLILIPGGSFMMGDDKHHQDEQPIHQVTVAPFWMGKYPITQAQYRAVMGDVAGMGRGADYPIEQINWHNATEFCRKLSDQTGQQYQLPSEAQWEYACRANTTTAYHFGTTITPDLVNYNGEYPYNGAAPGKNRAQATPVGTFSANGLGLHDMHGNVWEWCLDEYQPNYQTASIDGSAVVDSGSIDLNAKRVMRGGSWDYVAKGCRSAVRCSLDATLRIPGCGFRVVLTTLD